ncbi:unnamed protein product [Leptidea sinapis]|uniref:Uncharacterized protein n=1 Tax=Leptidea sinapis TaxID=189913 RepID=A0A5E4PKA5_9NEOP|nr:unnamed protein product [Leptidea sinapis]
MGINMKLGVLN